MLSSGASAVLELTVLLTSLDRIADVLGALSVNLATNAESCAKNLLHHALQVLGVRLKAHRPRNFNDIIERDGLAVLYVLLLLSVAWGLLQCTDDEGGGCGDDGDGGLSVLDGELDGHTQTLL